jgi:hypothetical protein
MAGLEPSKVKLKLQVSNATQRVLSSPYLQICYDLGCVE